jgi:hypothetical protein
MQHRSFEVAQMGVCFFWPKAINIVAWGIALVFTHILQRHFPFSARVIVGTSVI